MANEYLGQLELPNGVTYDIDKRVEQTSTSTSAFYEVILSGTADNTTRTEGVNKSNYFVYNPAEKFISVGTLKANTPIGEYSNAFGYDVAATADYSHAEGYGTFATGYYTHVEGYMSSASYTGAHAEGGNTSATGYWTHAEGSNTVASSYSAHAEGSSTTASGSSSHSEGDSTTASGDNSHAEGLGTTANHRSQHVFGEYNINDSASTGWYQRGDYVEIVGNGTDSDAKSNARTLDWSGNEWVAGTVTAAGGFSGNLTGNVTGNVTGTAGSVAWANVSNKPTKLSDFTNDVVNNATLTIQKNGTTVNTFTANASSNVTCNIEVPTTAADIGAIATTAKGANNGVAELDSTGKVPTSQLPSYVDDVVEYDSQSEFPATGETGKIYIAKDTNKTYRWSGTVYVEISPSLALGETSSTAYRGDRGKIAYDHSQLTSGNPHNVTKSDVGLGDVGNFKAVSTVASQGLTSTEQLNARNNIGLGTSAVKDVPASGNASSSQVVLGSDTRVTDEPNLRAAFDALGFSVVNGQLCQTYIA